MKNTSIKASIILTFLITTSLAKLHAQNKNIISHQDPKVEQLLNEKRKSNTSLSINTRYKIQIFSGTSELAKKSLNEFKLENKNTDPSIIGENIAAGLINLILGILLPPGIGMSHDNLGLLLSKKSEGT